MRLLHTFLTGSCALLWAATALAQRPAALSLQEALRLAQRNNPFLKADSLNLDLAHADETTARLRPNPNLSFHGIQLLKKQDFAPDTRWDQAYNRQVEWAVTKPLQIAGQRSNKITWAAAQSKVAQKEFLESQRQVLADVAQKWLEAWTAQKMVDMIRLAQSNIDSTVWINQLRYKNLTISQTDLLRTELLAKQYRLQRQTAEQDLKVKLNELHLQLGPVAFTAIDTAYDMLPGTPAGLDSLLDYSLQNRSDRQAARSQVEASDKNIKLQRSLAYPQPELGAVWNPQNNVPYWGASASIDLPFFNRNQGEIKRAQLEREQSQRRFDALEQTLRTEVANAYSSYHLFQANLEAFKGVLEQSQEILENVRYAYFKGGTSIIDFLEAQRSWLETQQQYTEALYQYRQAHIQLLFATGLIHQLAQ